MVENPKYFLLTVLRGGSFQTLNNQIPPNAFLLINGKKSAVTSRESCPGFDFNVVCSSEEVLIEVGHSFYGRSSQDAYR